MTIAASAPGKLVLIGEYGVLFGAPAVVMAVNRRATVRLAESEDGFSRVDSPGQEWEPARFTIEPDGGLRWCSTPRVAGRYLLFERIVDSLAEFGLVRPESVAPFTASLDTREFFRRGDGKAVKLGLGSSAALTVALASALLKWAGTGERVELGIEWLQRLLNLHRAYQGGRGSGVDLAASLMGGLVEYRLQDDGSVATAAPLDLPEGLFMAVVWTGRGADTGDFLGRLSLRMDGEGGRGKIDDALDRLGQAASAGVRRPAQPGCGVVPGDDRHFRRGSGGTGPGGRARDHVSGARRAPPPGQPVGRQLQAQWSRRWRHRHRFRERSRSAGPVYRDGWRSGFPVLDVSLDPAGLR